MDFLDFINCHVCVTWQLEQARNLKGLNPASKGDVKAWKSLAQEGTYGLQRRGELERCRDTVFSG